MLFNTILCFLSGTDIDKALLFQTQGQGSTVEAPFAVLGRLEIEEAAQGQKEPL